MNADKRLLPGHPVPIVETMPAPVGGTPFRAKGHIYLKMRDNMNATVDGGAEAVVAATRDRDAAAFFEQRFVAGGWYDALPMGPLAQTHARLLGRPTHQVMRERGREIAERDVPGVYRTFLKLVSPELFVGRAPRIASLYFDFGAATYEMLPPGRARTRLAGLPYSLALMMAGTVEGFMAASLEQCGGRDVVVRTLDATFDGGVVGGIPTAAVRHESSWRR